MKTLFVVILFLNSLFTCLFATEHLSVRDANSWWYNGWGTIKSASIYVEPKGVFAECTMVLELSANWSIYNFDSMEIDMNFKLPAGSEVIDLDLWINDEPIPGKWYDRWTASLIYESIVQRRIDPAILTKIDANEYNIKVFPLYINSSRKIKIRYLTPIINPLAEKPSVSIPLNILKLSWEPLSSLKLACNYGNTYSNPGLKELNNVSFSVTEDENFGSCQSVEIQNPGTMPSLNLVFDRESKNMDLTTYTDPVNGENYYQLSVMQRNLFDSCPHRKALFLVDFIDDNCSAYEKTDILDLLENSIRNSFGVKDSFNIFFSGMVTTILQETWVGGDSASISGFFNSLDVSVFNSYSALPALLIDGVDFLKNQGNQGSIVLVSSSNSNGTSSSANSLITDFINTLDGSEIPIHIIDLDDRYYYYNEQHYIGGQYYNGNEYFYTRLTQMTVGEYYSIRTSSLMNMLDQVNHMISGYFKSLEVFVKTLTGYAYSNFKLTNNSNLVYNDDALSITGQYVGTAPFIITVFGQSSNGMIFQVTDTLLAHEVQVGDSLLRTIWASRKIRDLMAQVKSNQIVNQIITTSLEEHVLTDYTAILVLEPGFQVPDIIAETDNEIIITVDDGLTTDSYNLTVYPNPVTSQSVVKYLVTGTTKIRLLLYNASGQLVSTLADETISAGQYTTPMHAESLEKGIYICILYADGKQVGRIKVVVL